MEAGRLSPLLRPDRHLCNRLCGVLRDGGRPTAPTKSRAASIPGHRPGGGPSSSLNDTELENGVNQLQFHEGHAFESTEFSDGSGVFLVCMVVPAPGDIGSSPDFVLSPDHLQHALPNSRDGCREPGRITLRPPPNELRRAALTSAIDPRFESTEQSLPDLRRHQPRLGTSWGGSQGSLRVCLDHDRRGWRGVDGPGALCHPAVAEARRGRPLEVRHDGAGTRTSAVVWGRT